jgi:F0F1-type ATP synthase epsilon subunit
VAQAAFHLQIMSLVRSLFEGEVESVYLFGDEGEYELLAYHYPLLGALPEGEIHIKGHEPIPIRAGAVLFEANRCVILVEELNTKTFLYKGVQHMQKKKKEGGAS